MKSIFVCLAFYLSPRFTAFCQTESEEPWTLEIGVSKHSVFKDFTGINLRFISPKLTQTNEDHYWIEEEEKHPEKFKRIRFLIELLYAPAFKVCTETCTNFVQIETPGVRMRKVVFPSYYVSSTTQLQEYAMSTNIQYRVLQCKRLYTQLTGGLKFFFLTSPEYGLVNFQKVFYWNIGLLNQLDLGWISPFADIGIDRIYTLGAELKFSSIIKKGKRRYKLHLRKNNRPA